MIYDGPYMLDLFNRLTGRSGVDGVTPTTKYTWLSEAQNEVVTEIARVAPHALYQKVATASLPQMVTTDHNVFTFGVDTDDRPIVPFGAVQIYRSVTNVPDRPMRPGVEYINEVSQIRLPRNRTFSSPLYWRGIVMPPPITASQAPGLLPIEANELTGIRAAHNFAESGNVRNPALADRMSVRWAERWPRWALVYKRQFSGGGALAVFSVRDLLTS